MISPRALVRLGVRSLLVHKLRSTLSILGVVFGVAAVVAMSSVGEGARREALAQVASLGIDSITVRHRPGADQPGSGLRLEDVESLRAVVPHLVAVAPLREARLQAEVTGRHTDVVALGTTPDYAGAARLQLERGRFLSDLDVREAKRVAVLGAAAARELFPLQDPRGERFRLGGDFFQVVGVLEGRAAPKGRGGPIRTRDINRAVVVPLPALDHGVDPRRDGIDEAVLRVEDGREVVASAEVVKATLRRTTAGAALDIVVPREILRQREATQRIFNVVTGAIAAISLLVGGIGIMNIMLASVAERTREVGIRRALGATQREIAAQFLVEASLLTLAGGALGALLGVLGAALIQSFATWPTALSPLLLLAALLVALLVGVGFGFYPAWAAAQLQPMEALRFE
ncbi:MAG TPA: ABC transporter permease [Vicinamibacteria bacterium]|nr:ABC transporter permease [Vicinamibacteria bacterium]